MLHPCICNYNRPVHCFRSPAEVLREKKGEKGVEEEIEEEELETRVKRKMGQATPTTAQPKRW